MGRALLRAPTKTQTPRATCSAARRSWNPAWRLNDGVAEESEDLWLCAPRFSPGLPLSTARLIYRRANQASSQGLLQWRNIPVVTILGAATRLLRTAITRLGLSARGYHRVLKIARTVADLDGAAELEPKHVSEAIQYRSLDRRGIS